MRVLVTTNAAVGHFLPLVPTIRALTGAGHDVRVACPGSFAPFVRRAGLPVLPCEERVVASSVPPAPPRDRPDERLRWAVTASWPDDCRSWVDPLLDAARAWRPDVVVVEAVEHAGRVVAAALDVPLVVHGWGFSLPGDVEEAAVSGLADLYAAAGTAPRRPALTADLGPASIQSGDAGTVDRFRYVPFSVPGDAVPPRGDRPRVLVTLGTYANSRAAAGLRAAVDGVREAGAEAVVVLGGHVDRGTRDQYPADATVLDWVHLPDAVTGCDLVVHHGGAGTSWATLVAGRPAVVVPQGGDQFRNAALLESAGAAVVASVDQPEGLRAAISAGLSEPRLGAAAARIADENAALPGVDRLAAAIAAVA